MADIQATTAIDTRPFIKGLDTTLKAARTWKRNVEKTMNFDGIKTLQAQINRLQRDMAKGTKTPKALDALAKAPKTARDVEALTEAVRQNATEIRNLELAYDRGEVSQESFIQQMSQLRGASEGLATGLEQDSRALTTLGLSMRRADRAMEKSNRSIDEGVVAAERYRAASTGIRRAVEARTMTEEQAIEAARRYAQEARTAAEQTEEFSKEQLSLLNSAATLERTLATLEGRLTTVGLSKNVAIANADRLNDSWRGMQGVLTGLLGGAGFGRLIRFTEESARSSADAATQLSLFYSNLQSGGYLLSEGQAMLRGLAAEFKTTEEAVATHAASLLAEGYTLNQITDLFRAVGVAALENSRDVVEGFEAIETAILAERSGSLQRLGITGRLTVALGNEARAQNKTVDALDKKTKAQVISNHVLSQTGDSLENLNALFAGYVGAQSEATAVADKFNRSLGHGFAIALTPFIRGFTALQKLFLSMPQMLQTLIGVVTVLGAILGMLAGAYLVLNTEMVRTRVIGGTLEVLLRNETILRSRLGAVLLTMASRYKLLGAAQLESAAAARTAAVANTANTGSLINLGAIFTRIGTFLRGLPRLLGRIAFNPVTIGLTLIVGLLQTIQTMLTRFANVFAPAFKVFKDSVDSLRTAFQPLVNSVKELFSETGLLGRAWNAVLLVIAAAAARQIVNLSFHVERAAIALRFLRRVLSGDWSGNLADMNKELEQLRKDTDAALASIDEAVEAARRGGDALTDFGDDGAAAAEQLADAEAAVADLASRIDSLELDLTGTALERELGAIKDQFIGFYEELEDIAARSDDNPFLIELTEQMRERLQALEALARDQAIQKTIADFENEIAQAQLDAMEAGSARINAEYDQRVQETRQNYAEALSALEAGTDAYAQVLELSNMRIAQLEAARTRDLEAAAAEQLAEAQALVDQIEQIERDLAKTDIGFMRDATDRTMAEFDMAATEISERYADLMSDITAEDEAAVQARLQLQELLTRELAQNEEQRRRELERINQERIEASLQAAARANDLELQLAQSSARNAREVAAIELERRLADIAEVERQQIAQAEETGIALADVEREAGLQRALARQEHADAILEIEEQTAARVTRLQQDAAKAAADLQMQQLQFTGQDRAAIEAQYEQQVRAAVAAFDEIRDAKESTNAEIRAAEQLLNTELERAAFERARSIAAIDVQGVQERLSALQDSFNRGILDKDNVDDLRDAISAVGSLRDELLSLAGSQEAVASLDTVLQGLNDELESLTGLAPNLERAANILNQLESADVDARRQEIDLIEDTAEQLQARFALEAELRDRELTEMEGNIRERVQHEELANRLISEARESTRTAHLLAEQQLTRDLEAEAVRRAQATADALTSVNTELQQARISLLAGEADRLQATFELERDLRQAEQEAQLRDFEGNQVERRRLMQAHQELELALTEQHNRELATLQADALESYADAVRDAYRDASQVVAAEAGRINTEITAGLARLNERGLQSLRAGLQSQVDELRAAGVAEEALEPFLTALEAADEASRTFMERDLLQRAEAVRITREYTAVLNAESATRERQARLFRQQLRQYQSEAALINAAADAARERGAAEEELMPILERQAAVQRETITGINDQIRVLQEQRAEQLRLTQAGSDVLNYYRALAELTGQADTSRGQREIREGLEAQRDLTRDMLEDAVEQNQPLEERVRLSQELLSLEQQVAEAGGRTMRRSDLTEVMADARAELAAFPTEAERAISEVNQLDSEIVTLNKALESTLTTLGGITGELSDMVKAFDGAGASPGIDADSLVSDFKAELQPLLDAAADELAAAAGTSFEDTFTAGTIAAGQTAGAGLMNAFAAGIRQNEAALLAAVDSVLQQVRDRLPGSDARTGPLSSITASGRAFLPTFMSGMQRSVPQLNRFMDRTLSGLLPTSGALSTRMLPFAGAGGPTHIHYDGNPAPAPLAQSARSFVREVKAEAKRRKLVK